MSKPICKTHNIPKRKRASDGRWQCPQCKPVKKTLLSPAAEKAISRWAENEFYVYIRPMTSLFVDRSNPHSVYWVVQVEYRTIPPGSWRAEGLSLNDVIRELDQTVPRRRTAHRIDQEKHPGLNAPEKAQKKAQKIARASRTRSSAKRKTKA